MKFELSGIDRFEGSERGMKWEQRASEGPGERKNRRERKSDNEGRKRWGVIVSRRS